MKALRTVAERQVEVLDLPIPHPEPGEVVIQMKSTGICGSDLHPYRRPTQWHLAPGSFISGHEPSGVIAEIGQDVTGWQVGDRVVPFFRRVCNRCVYCRAGLQNVCIDRRASYGHQGCDGSHAEYMRVEATYLMPLPEYLSFVEGAILACQGGTAYAPLARMGVSGRDVLVVSGLGPVGLLSAILAQAMGATVVGIDPSPGRRAIGEKLGCVLTLDPATESLGEQLRAHFPDGADKLTETSGATSAHKVIGSLVRPRATIALVGGGSPDLVMPLGHLGRTEANVFGSSAYSPVQWGEITEFVHRNGVDLPSVVSETHPLANGVEAFRIAADANTGKVMFRFE